MFIIYIGSPSIKVAFTFEQQKELKELKGFTFTFGHLEEVNRIELMAFIYSFQELFWTHIMYRSYLTGH